jgi:hypothetical protein
LPGGIAGRLRAASFVTGGGRARVAVPHWDDVVQGECGLASSVGDCGERGLAVAWVLADDGVVMGTSDQALVEFAVLAVTGIVVSAVAASMVTDYRGSLTRYAHSCWRFYQRRWYQRLFLWTSSSRAHYADEAWVRRTLRLGAIPGLAIGALILAIEFVALFTGHVT